MDPSPTQIDNLCARWDKTTSPGCALAVIREGEIVYCRGYGMANLELGVPITGASVFYLASMSKQFAATAACLLVERGDLALSDDIRTYVPELPDYDVTITVSHLIRHTSGLRDYLELGWLAGKRMEDVWTEAEVMGMLMRQTRLNFAPGSQYVYSNSGYILLSRIIRRITGQSLGEFAREHIFRPLGMRHSAFKEHHQQIIPNRVSGYSEDSTGGFVNEYHNLQLVGDGGLYASVEDLFLWDQNFYANRLGWGEPSLIDLLQTTVPLNDGTPQSYALGLGHDRYRGVPTVKHGGGLNGARTQMVRFPEQRFTVICLSNLSQFNPEEMIRRVADLYLAEQLSPVAATGDTAATDEAAVSAHPGLYRNDDRAITKRVALEGGELVLRTSGTDRTVLLPVSDTIFRADGLLTRFEFTATDADSEAEEGRTLTEVASSGTRTVYPWVEAAHPPVDTLGAYGGTFHSPELAANFQFDVADESLIWRRIRDEDVVLHPTVADAFCGDGFEFVFERNKDGAVTGFALYTGRIRAIEFQK